MELYDNENSFDKSIAQENIQKLKTFLYKCALDEYDFDEDFKDEKIVIDFGDYLNIYNYQFINYIITTYGWNISGDSIKINKTFLIFNNEFTKYTYHSKCGKFLLIIEIKMLIVNSKITQSEFIKCSIVRTTDNKIIRKNIETQKDLRKVFMEIKFCPYKLLYK